MVRMESFQSPVRDISLTSVVHIYIRDVDRILTKHKNLSYENDIEDDDDSNIDTCDDEDQVILPDISEDNITSGALEIKLAVSVDNGRSSR